MVVLSLNMLVSHEEGRGYVVLAPWMDEPIERRTFEEAYWAAIAERSSPKITKVGDAE